jgi:hypothetical protein
VVADVAAAVTAEAAVIAEAVAAAAVLAVEAELAAVVEEEDKKKGAPDLSGTPFLRLLFANSLPDGMWPYPWYRHI